MRIIEAVKEHIEEIARIESTAFSAPRSKRDFEKALEDGISLLAVSVTDDGRIAGYIWLRYEDIVTVAVDSEYRRKGIAAALIDFVKKRAVGNIFLEVRKSNTGAINLYQRAGFRKVSERKRYYSDGEDALVYMFGGEEI